MPAIGYEGGALLFGAALTLIALLYFLTEASHSALFWSAFILTRPLGATIGDLLTKPRDEGGFDLNRIVSSAIIATIMAGLISLASRRKKESLNSSISNRPLAHHG
jgi:uncharacterized membrane-anchored protein